MTTPSTSAVRRRAGSKYRRRNEVRARSTGSVRTAAVSRTLLSRSVLLNGVIGLVSATRLAAAGQVAPPPQSVSGRPAPTAGQADAKPDLARETERKQTADTGNGTPAEDLVVTAQQLRGAARTELTPERTFSPLEIQSYGASSLDEVLQGLQIQTKSVRSGEGAPVLLVNGRRTPNLTAIASVPAEAIERVEIYPEEVALAYGYRPDQKVVNIVLFERFSNATATASVTGPTDGAGVGEAVAPQRFVIRGSSMLSLSADAQHTDDIRESDRGIIQPVAAVDGRTRTLLPSNDRILLNGSFRRSIGGMTSASLHLRGEMNEGSSLLGTNAGGSQLKRRTANSNLLADGQLDGIVGRWQWSAIGSADRVASTIDTTPDRAVNTDLKSINQTFGGSLQAGGPVLRLPAGNLTASFRGDFDARRLTSEYPDGAGQHPAPLRRSRAGLLGSVSVPITRPGARRLPLPGSLSVDASGSLDHFSDYGDLWQYTYGIAWAPVPTVTILASKGTSRSVPTLEQTGSAPVTTPNVRTFDFISGDTVDISRTFGGNRSLLAQTTRSFNAGIEATSILGQDLTVSVDYSSIAVTNQIGQFPIVTDLVQQAYPNRFMRSSAGQLLGLDASAVNFRRLTDRQLRYGLNFTRPFKSVPRTGPPTTYHYYSSEAEMKRHLPPGATLTRVVPGSPAAKRLENVSSRFFVSIYHTVHLADTVSLSDHVRTLDLLRGDAVGFLGGQRRHEVEGQVGLFKKGIGGRLTVDWKSATSIDGLGASGDRLRFASLSRADIVVFCNIAERFPGVRGGLLDKTRLTFTVLNILNTRPQVFDRTGVTPISYQAAYLDPIGRTVGLSLRKIL